MKGSKMIDENKFKDIKFGEIGSAIMPFSEVCVHLRVAGRLMYFRIVGDKYPMAQLIDPLNGHEYSFPITLGEAGVYEKDCIVRGVKKPKDREYYYYPSPKIGPNKD